MRRTMLRKPIIGFYLRNQSRIRLPIRADHGAQTHKEQQILCLLWLLLFGLTISRMAVILAAAPLAEELASRGSAEPEEVGPPGIARHCARSGARGEIRCGLPP